MTECHGAALAWDHYQIVVLKSAYIGCLMSNIGQRFHSALTCRADGRLDDVISAGGATHVPLAGGVLNEEQATRTEALHLTVAYRHLQGA